METKVTIPALQKMKREGRKIVGVVGLDYQIAADRRPRRSGSHIGGDSVGVNLWGTRRTRKSPWTRC